MKRTTASLLVLAMLAALLCGCGSTQAPQGSTAPLTTLPLETAAPETESEPETEPVTTVEAVPVQTDSQYESAQPGIAEPVITTGQTAVHVSTADEFLAAIASDTEIIVDAELIDFSTASNYGAYGTSEGNYRWNEEFDGPELIIQNVTNLTIRGSGEERTDKVLSCVPRYADVLTFENCANIYVTHITVGHTQEQSQCSGGVLHFVSSQDILVEDCDLYGCGTLGVDADNSLNIQVINNLIHDCSYGGVELSLCQNVRVDGNTFRDLGMEDYPGCVFRIYDSVNVTCNGMDAIPFQ